MSVSITLQGQATLATRLKSEVLPQKISAEEGLAILVAYLVRQGTITEITLPPATG